MSRRTVFDRATGALSHPVSILALLVLLLNALVLQPYIPSWWTGKLGDAAWLVFAPFLVTLCLGLFVKPERVAFHTALAITSIGFAAVKTLHRPNSAVNYAFTTLTGVPLKLALDPSDLITLPALGVAYWLWMHPLDRPAGRPRAWLALALVGAAILADAPAPMNLGISCFAPRGSTIYAVNRWSQNREFGGATTYIKVYASADGGAHWASVDSATLEGLDSKEPCKDRTHDSTWTLRDPTRDNVQYVFLAHQGIYESTDSGKTLKLQMPLDSTQSVLDAVVDPATGNVIATTGGRGVVLRSQDRWTNTVVGSDSY